MSFNEIVIVGGVALGFATLRFGVPLVVTWGVGRLLRTLNGTAA